MTDSNPTTETISPDRLRELIEVYNLQCFRGDTALALEELERLRHYVATCGGTDNDGRCPMHHLAGVSPGARDKFPQSIGYLIEYQAPDRARWMTATDDDTRLVFQDDASKAVRFSKREGAAAMLRYLKHIQAFPSNDGLSVTEHVWIVHDDCGDAPSVSPEPSDDAIEQIAALLSEHGWHSVGDRTRRHLRSILPQIGALIGSVSPEPRDEPLPPCSTCGGETVPFCTSCGYTTTKPAEYPAYTECQHDHMKPNPTLRATYPKHGSQSGWVQEYRCNVCQCSFERPIATAGLRANGETP